MFFSNNQKKDDLPEVFVFLEKNRNQFEYKIPTLKANNKCTYLNENENIFSKSMDK